MLFTIAKTLLIAIMCCVNGVAVMHFLQMRRYSIQSLRAEMHQNNGLLRAHVIIAALTALLNWYLPIFLAMAITQQDYREKMCGWLMLGLFVLVAAGYALHRSRIPQRKPFVWTQRIIRLCVLVFLLDLLCVAAFTALGLSAYLVFAVTEYIVLLAALIIQPLENRLNARYYNSARQKLTSMPNLTRIAITGSFGKTETKMILRGILSEKFRVLATPPSFSSAMGISRIVHEQLTRAHEVFIVEMGAQNKGDIREMIKLVRPKYGVLTCIGNEHINVFGSMESIAQTKYEMIQTLPKDGAAFFGSDAGFGDRLYGICKMEKYRSGIDPEVQYFLHAENVEIGAEGMRFDMCRKDGARVRIKTKLLGIYNVRNIMIAASVALKMGMSMEEIAAACEKLPPLRHHMQHIPGRVHLIDDSDNRRCEPAVEALRVLKKFPGKRIVVTEGFLAYEAGGAEKNHYFGAQIRKNADYAILINPERTRDIVNGIFDKEFPKGNVRIVRDPEDAIALVEEIAKEGDTVLYECTHLDSDY